MMRRPLVVFAVFALCTDAKLNAYSKTPTIGFNTYNDILCSPNETYVQQRMDQLQQRGFISAGYKLFHLDCGWSAFNRASDGSLTWDPDRFPNGILPLSQKAASLGMDWGMYTDTGLYMCDTAGFEGVKRPASRDHEFQDATSFKAWNASYVKIDNCWLAEDSQGNHDPRSDYPDRYGRFSTAFDQVGIPRLAVCQWAVPYIGPNGLQGPAEWTAPLATSYRVADDVYHSWFTVLRVMNEALNVNMRGLNGPGNFVDMDILEVGNGDLTLSEQQSHFAIWAGFKSTLLASTNLATPSADTLNILLNKNLIAINQDPLGKPAVLVQRYSHDYDIYAGPLANGDVFVLLFDQSNTRRTLQLAFSKLRITSADVKDLWSGKVTRSASSYSGVVEQHGNLALRLSNIKKSTAGAPLYKWFEAETGTFTNGAAPSGCSGCSGNSRVAHLCGDGPSFTLTGLPAKATTMDVAFDYINAQYAIGDDSYNVRGASIIVNGGSPQYVEFPFAGYNYDTDVWKSYLVRLGGFISGSSNNTMTVTTQTPLTFCAPDLDRIGFPV